MEYTRILEFLVENDINLNQEQLYALQEKANNSNNDRVKIYKTAIKISRETIKELSKKLNNNSLGMSIPDLNSKDEFNDAKYQYEEFISGRANSVAIMYGDLDSFYDGNKDRPENKNLSWRQVCLKWNKILDLFEKTLSYKLADYGTVEFNGEKEGGEYTLSIKKGL